MFLPLLRVVIVQCSGHLADADVAVKYQQRPHSQHYSNRQNKQSQCSPLIAFKRDLLITKILLHDPYTLSNYVKIIESKYTQQAEKRLVVLPTNTIIQKFAVMVELLSATVTCKAVMAARLHLIVTQYAENQLVVLVSLYGLFF